MRLSAKINLVLLLFFCFGFYQPRLLEASVPFEDLKNFPEQEAILWLKKNDIARYLPLLGCKTQESLKRFVERLYKAGAIYVGIVIVMEEPVGLRVYLPQDELNRQDIIRIANCKDSFEDNIVIWFKPR